MFFQRSLISAKKRSGAEKPMYLVVVMSPGPQNIVWKLLLTKTTNSLPFFSSQDKTLNVISDGLPKSCSWTLSSSKTISFYHDPFQHILRIILFGGLILKWKKCFFCHQLIGELCPNFFLQLTANQCSLKIHKYILIQWVCRKPLQRHKSYF